MKKAVIFDLDGTIYYSDHIIEGVFEVLHKLQSQHIQTLFFTNNSSKNREDIYKKLIGLNIKCHLNQVYNSTYATALYLKHHKFDKVFLIGSESFKQEIERLAISLVKPHEAQAVVVGLKTDFSYDDISQGLNAVRHNAKLIVTNVDKNFPVSKTEVKPGCNAIVSSIIGSCHKKIEPIIIGKPQTYILESICSDWNLNKNDIIVVGDSMESDIEMANRYGCDSLLVGESGVNIKYVLEKVNI